MSTATAEKPKKESRSIAEMWTPIQGRDDNGRWSLSGFMNPDPARAQVVDEITVRKMKSQGLGNNVVRGVYRSCYIYDRGFCVLHEKDIKVNGRVLGEIKVPPPAAKKSAVKAAPPTKRPAPAKKPPTTKRVPPAAKKAPPRKS